MGHLNRKDLTKLLNIIMGRENMKPTKNEICDICARGKMTTKSFPKGKEPYSEILRIEHIDEGDRFEWEPWMGHDISPLLLIAPECAKYISWKKRVEHSKSLRCIKGTQRIRQKLKILQNDIGTEYLSGESEEFLSSCGIERRLTVLRTPQQNGVAQHMGRTLMDMTRCLLLQLKLPAQFWTDEYCPLFEKQVFDQQSRRKNSDSNMDGRGWCEQHQNFWFQVHDVRQGSDERYPRLEVGVFIGYPRETKGYRVWLLNERKTIVAREFQSSSKKSKRKERTVRTLMNY